MSFVDVSGTKHTAEVTAESLYEAAVTGLKTISETWAEQPRLMTPITISVVPVEHQVSLKQDSRMAGEIFTVSEGIHDSKSSE